MVQRGLIIAASLCVVFGAGAWKTGLFQSDIADAAETAQTVQTASVTAAGAAKAGAEIDGFRSAKFGMTEDAVRAAILTDFNKSSDDIKAAENPVQRTKSLTVRTSNLIPETGEARISYIFGYKSNALIQVNVLWGTTVTADITGADIARTALILKSYFESQSYNPKHIIRDRRMRNGVLLFQSTDAAKHLVRLIYLSAPFQAGKQGDKLKNNEDTKAAKKSAYALSLNYISNPAAPDILTIKAGEF